ncbi:MAG: SCO family protein [Paracoccus sp. (in: a-proteobacteria)]
MRDKQIMTIGVISATALLVGGWFWLDSGNRDNDRFAYCRASAIAGGAATIGGTFTLTDDTGAQVSDQQVFTKPSLLYFGYSFCPDVCPFDNSRNAEAIDLLDQQGIDAQPVFVSVDPKRDTPEVLSQYADNLHEKMIGLTGSPENIAAAAKAWRVAYQVPDTEDEDYLVSHTTMTFLVLPEYGTVEFFSRDVTADEMADRVACYVQASD